MYVAKKDQITHLSVVEEIARLYGTFINVGLYVVEDVAEVSADLKREFKTNKLPLFRFYPNLKTGEDKRNASFNIVLPSSGEIDDVKETVLEEVKNNFSSDVKDVSEKVYYSIGS